MLVYKFLPTEFALKTIRERRLKISRLDELNDPFDLLPFDLRDKNVREEMYKLRDEFIETFGVMCFSKAWHDPVIWAHYADKHKGMCLRFEVPDSEVMEVEYLGYRLRYPKGKFEADHLISALTVKYKNWKYEQEVRWIIDLPKPEGGIHYHNFRADTKLVEVVVGSESTVPLLEIRAALGDTGAKVKLRKAIASFGSFRIRENESGFRHHKEVPLKKS